MASTYRSPSSPPLVPVRAEPSYRSPSPLPDPSSSSSPPPPPSSIRLSTLPDATRTALGGTERPAAAAAATAREPLRPTEPNVMSQGTAARGESKRGQGKEKDGQEYAYEYVSVAQRREGRENITYEMKMRQQPVQARMCGVGEKSDRRPVDPTPIIQLKVIDRNGEDVTGVDPRYRDSGDRRPLRRPEPGPGGMTFMQNPYYFLFACLVGGDEKEDELHVIDDGKTRFLTGTPVSSLYHLKDLDNTDAAFFVFPDLGVRKEGRYKLKLTLFEIVDQEVFYCTTMYTSTFSVYSAKKFPGMSRATDLSKTFAEQGLKIRVRKDSKRRVVKAKRKSNQSEDEDPNNKRSRPSDPAPENYFRPPPPGQPEGYYQNPPPPGHPGQYPPGYPYHPSQAQGQRMPPPPPPQGPYDQYRGPAPQGYYPPPGYPMPPGPPAPPNQGPPGPTRHLPPRARHSMPPGPGDYYAPQPYPPGPGGPYEVGRPNVPWPQGRAPPPQQPLSQPPSASSSRFSHHPSQTPRPPSRSPPRSAGSHRSHASHPSTTHTHGSPHQRMHEGHLEATGSSTKGLSGGGLPLFFKEQSPNTSTAPTSAVTAPEDMGRRVEERDERERESRGGTPVAGGGNRMRLGHLLD